MLHVIGGLAQATTGRVLLDGNDLAAMSDAERTKLRRHKVGFVFQRFNLLPTLDAYGQYRAGPAHPREWIRSAPLRRGHEDARP